MFNGSTQGFAGLPLSNDSAHAPRGLHIFRAVMLKVVLCQGLMFLVTAGAAVVVHYAVFTVRPIRLSLAI